MLLNSLLGSPTNVENFFGGQPTTLTCLILRGMSLGDEDRERDEAEEDLEEALPPPGPLPPRASLLFLRSLLLLRERLEDDRDEDLRVP